jgi:hypothetical protein
MSMREGRRTKDTSTIIADKSKATAQQEQGSERRESKGGESQRERESLGDRERASEEEERGSEGGEREREKHFLHFTSKAASW